MSKIVLKIKFKSHKTKFYGDYYLRWWRLPIEERACPETDLGGGDYYLRNSGLPPSLNTLYKLYFLNLNNLMARVILCFQTVLANKIHC